jgi:hypothetical protein
MPSLPAPNQTSETIAGYATMLNAQFPPGNDSSGKYVNLGEDYTKYMEAHPSADPGTIYSEVVARVQELEDSGSAIGNAVSTAVSAEGNVVGEIPKDVFPSLNPANDVIGGINIGTLILRAGEIILGIVLIGVGVAKLSGADNVISTAVKVAK